MADESRRVVLAPFRNVARFRNSNPRQSVRRQAQHRLYIGGHNAHGRFPHITHGHHGNGGVQPSFGQALSVFGGPHELPCNPYFLIL